MSDLSIREVPYAEVAELIQEKLTVGLFLTTQAEGAVPNTMTIGWGGLGRFFNMPVFYVPVRKSRYTYGLLKGSGEFTVSVPLSGMKAEIAFAGTVSGRDVDKFNGHGLTAAPAQEVHAPIVKECGLHLECRVTAFSDMTESTVTDPMLSRWYGDRDMHTLFFGQILRCYYTE